MASNKGSTDILEFPGRRRTRLRVSVASIDASGARVESQNTLKAPGDDLLKAAQQEIVDQEVFYLLSTEASNLPTVSARVSERLIIIDAAQGTELKFELVCAVIFFIEPDY